MKRNLFGVIAAQAADIEQREILRGVFEAAQQNNTDIVVLSNLYNPIEPNDALNKENEIYDLILSQDLDGLILISEVFINPILQRRILSNLQQQQKLPIIAIGTPLPDFLLPNFHFINTNDADDIEDVTNHLIDVHGFTDIHILTGHAFIEASNLRVKGYQKALEAHGIPFSERKVFYGDFWMNSGQALAQRYLQKELPLPEAILCTNDYMAYGILDTFLEHGIQVPEDVTVVGYEYVRNRLQHSPILTTYQRNRAALGVQAVQLLTEKLTTGTYSFVTPPTGRMIHGDSCSCGIAREKLHLELKATRSRQTDDFLNQFSQFDHCLTECSCIYDFIQVCRDFWYLIQGVEELYLCLYDSWYENAADQDTMACYSILSEQQTLPLHRYEFSKLFHGNPAAYYCIPLFFSKKTLGYVVLKCSSPDAYNHTFPNWIKSVSNGLEVLRMKNDIQYLTKCQSFAGQRDSLTNLYNQQGMEAAYHAMKTTDASDFAFVLLKICLSENAFSYVDQKIAAILDAADAVTAFCGTHGFCGRINDTVFACFLPQSKLEPAHLVDRLTSVFLQKKQYIENYGMDSFLCMATQCHADCTNSELMDFSISQLNHQTKLLSEKRIQPYYQEMLKIRNAIYLHPKDNISAERMGSEYAFSSGHLRVLYKNCFGVSIHQDCIRAKIAKAKNLLCTTDLSIRHIADQCGYHDEKYFLRQFSKETGYTPHQYRTLV